MFETLFSPVMPYVAGSLAGACIAGIGIVQMERQNLLRRIGVTVLPTASEQTRRMIVAQIAALPLALFLVLMTALTGVQGTPRLLLLAIALLSYLYIGLVIPRAPIVKAQKERAKLRSLTPGLVSFVRVSLSGSNSETILRRSIARLHAAKLPMQVVVQESLNMVASERKRPFEALALIATARGCQELRDVAESLAQAEQQGADVRPVLEQQEKTLVMLLEDDFKRMLERRKVYIMGLAAIGLVVGVLINLMYVMVIGSGVLAL